MPAKKSRNASTKRPTTKRAPAKRAAKKGDVPQMFRMNLEVNDVAKAGAFYSTLFGVDARPQAGSRVYVPCGAMTLQVVDVSARGAPQPVPKALYFTVRDLEAVHARASSLGCLSNENVHGVNGGAITTRPWGERSFYVDDPWRNQLCFVEAGTTYPG